MPPAKAIIAGFEYSVAVLIFGLVIVLNQPTEVVPFPKNSAQSLKSLLAEPVTPPSEPPAPYVPPAEVKGLYITSYTVLSPRLADIKKLLERTELNSVVINVNDVEPLAINNPNLAKVVAEFNALGIHTIARIVVWQNEPLVKAHPEYALKTSAGKIWADRGGHHWIDAASPGARQAILEVSQQAARIGFRELNYDYIRFPSDGAVDAIVYPSWDKKMTKAEVINSLGQWLRTNLKATYPDLTLSADIFGHAILVGKDDDAGIGQNFVSLVKSFDVICPMVYPSHYRAGNFGFANPAANPYGVVKGTLEEAKKKLAEAGQGDVIIRPWLQDFDLGADYTPAMIRQQIKAVEDAGYDDGWLLWNAANIYTAAALRAEL